MDKADKQLSSVDSCPDPKRSRKTRKEHLPREFWVIWAGTFINQTGFFVIPLMMAYLTYERGLSLAAAGALLALQGIGAVASSWIGGILSDRIGRRRTILLGLTSTACCLLFLAATTALWQLSIVVALLGLSSALHRPAANASVADIVPSEGRMRAYGLLNWASNLGLPISMVAAGLIVRHSFLPLFFVDAASCLAFAALIWTRMPETGASVRQEVVRDPTSRVSRGVFGDWRLLAVCAMTLIGFVIYFQWMVTVPLATRSSGLGAADYSFLIALNGLVVAVLQPLILKLFGQRCPAPVLAASYAVVGVGVSLTGAVDTLPAFAGTVILWSLGEIGMAAMGPALVANMAPASCRGRYLGLYGAVVGGAIVLAPIFGVALYSARPNLLWASCAGGGLVIAVGQLLLKSSRDSRRPSSTVSDSLGRDVPSESHD